MFLFLNMNCMTKDFAKKYQINRIKADKWFFRINEWHAFALFIIQITKWNWYVFFFFEKAHIIYSQFWHWVCWFLLEWLPASSSRDLQFSAFRRSWISYTRKGLEWKTHLGPSCKCSCILSTYPLIASYPIETFSSASTDNSRSAARELRGICKNLTPTPTLPLKPRGSISFAVREVDHPSKRKKEE